MIIRFLFITIFSCLSFGATFAADEDALCPGEDKLAAFPREVLNVVFWEAGGIDRLALHSEDPKEVSFRILVVDDQNEQILDGLSVHLLNLAMAAPFAMPSPVLPGNNDVLSTYLDEPRFSELARGGSTKPVERLKVFFIRDGISDQTEIERMIDDFMRRDGSTEEDTIAIDECKITRLRRGWEIGSTKVLFPRENSRKQDLECAVSALLFHYGISNADYINKLEKAVEIDGRTVANLRKSILRGLYSTDPSYPRFQPGMTRCEFTSRFLGPISK